MGLIKDIVTIIRKDKELFLASNVFMFGLFLLGMISGYLFPGVHDFLTNFMGESLKSGMLSPIVETVQSGDILRGALGIFAWNYFVATILLGSVPAIVFPPWILFKFGLSSLVAGIVFAGPGGVTVGWLVGTIGTLLLEFEGYVVAIFASMRLIEAAIWPRRFGETSRPKAYVKAIVDNAKLLLAAGVILLVAALYEAAAIILLR